MAGAEPVLRDFLLWHQTFAVTPDLVLVIDVGNPWVFLHLPLPLPTKTHTHSSWVWVVPLTHTLVMGFS